LHPVRNDSPHNFAELGHEWLTAAKVLNANGKNWPGGPIYFLAFQALELYLKAYLLRKGATLQHVTYKIGHSIQLAIKEAEGKGLGLNLDPRFRQTLMEFSDAYKRRDCQYRGNQQGPVFLPGDLISFVDEVRSKS
jgi:HEPN domain-containing protein